jgi:hypothetical protein
MAAQVLKMLLGWMTAEQGTVRRWLAGVLAVLAIALNHRFGLALTTEDIAAITVIVTGLVLGSNYKEAQRAKLVAEERARREVTDLPGAVAALREPHSPVVGPQP